MKKKIVCLGLTAFILVIVVVVLYSSKYKKQVYVEEGNNQIRTGTSISMMLETKYNSGNYEPSSSSEWPTDGYTFNSERSKCENGGTLSWNEETNSVVLTTRFSDKCFVYFDVEPPDVYITSPNLPTTYGKLGAITCSNSSATYNQQYNRIEVSNINTKYENCTLNYTDSTSKVNLATYITGLAGTTQGAGQVVNETITKDNSTFTAGAKLEQSSYTVSSNDATYPFEWDDTNKTWTSTNHTDNATATFIFNVATVGNYQVCYKQSSEQNYDYTIFYKDNTQIKSLKGISNSDFECYYLGSLATSNAIKVTYQKDGSGSNGSDNVIFYLQSGTYNENIQNVSTGIRYEGKNPNNYVWFNNEYWRIIGVFDNSSHDQSGKNLVKIIRDDALGGLAWDKSRTNDWTTASLNKLLNGAYYNAQDGTSSGYCYGSSSALTNCNYTKKGIQLGYRGMIAKVTWYLGGYSSASATAETFYGYERGTTVYSGRTTSTTGYIGLMYPSDYGYSVLSSSCARTTNLSSYDSSTCVGQSWLSGKGAEWTITPHSSSNRIVFPLDVKGALSQEHYGRYTGMGEGVRPVLYLDASVYKIDGEGTLDNPYIIGM